MEVATGAQHAVSIPEIVSYILSFVGAEDARRAALVCHTWNTLALPFIWDNLRSLLPLLRILSRLKKLNDRQPEWEPVGEPETWKWERFWERARQVRSLRLVSHISATSLSTRVVTLLKSNLPPGQNTILPSIRQLWWFGMSESSISQFLDFLSPSLRDVRFVLGSPKDIKEGNAALEQLASRQDIVLQDFYVGALYDALQNVAPSPCLGKHWKLRSLILPPFGARDPVLESLDYHTNLQILQVELLPSGLEHIQCTLSKIAKAVPGIRILKVTLNSPRARPIRFHYLSPLLECHFIEELKLKPFDGIDITEEDVKAMGRSWLRLRRLEIYPTWDRPGCPLSFLSALAKYMSPNLQSLDLSLSCDDVPPFPGPPVRISGLTTLRIHHSSVESEDVQAVARFLAAVCPETTAIEYHRSSVPLYTGTGSWERVIDLVGLEWKSRRAA